MNQKIEDSLNPEIVKIRLISASIYIASFQALKDAIVSKLRYYYCLDISKNWKPCKEYTKNVLNRNSSPVHASLDWFKEMEAINDEDLETFELIKRCRNELSHGLLSLIGSKGLPENFEIRFQQLKKLLHKIDLWWVINVEIATDPDFPDMETDEKNIQVGSVLSIEMLVNISLGNEEVANMYYNEYIKCSGKDS